MLTATQGKSVEATQKYFDTSLTQGDYYTGQEIRGTWNGRGAEILGLKKGEEVSREQFAALLSGKHPRTGETLTQRNRSDRRPGIDLTFSVPKSVSLVWALNNDRRVLDVLKATVQETMANDVEPLVHRRVRKGEFASSNEKKQTGKLVFADFLHKTSRPVDGKPDPHLHIHAYVINWTEDKGKHYAAELEEVIRQRPSLQAKFEARLARRLQNDLGYKVKRVSFSQSGRLKQGWEIDGISREMIEKFSRRTEQVEREAKKAGITNAALKGKLAAKFREKKDKSYTTDDLRQYWSSRLSSEETKALKHLRVSTPRSKQSELQRSEEVVRFAVDHHLFRQSTVERHQVVGTALEQGLTLTPETVEATLDRMEIISRSRVVEGAKRQFITTREVLASEKEMIAYARDGRGTVKAISRRDHAFSRDWLNDQQKAAVNHVLQSRDKVVAVTGGAGTGKSSLMQEAAEAVGRHGREVFVFAPSTGAREVLEEKGFRKAQTVEHLLRNTELQSQVAGQVIWIDEAGLLDVRSMNGVFEIAKKAKARVVLSGDTRQHSSPRRGEAMRLLETEAGLSVARVEAIQRQKGKYREAVELISRGHEPISELGGKSGLVAGFDLLDRMGKIKELDAENRNEFLAEQYLSAEQRGKSALVVAPTNAEGRAVTEFIRDQRRASGALASDETEVTRLQALNLSEAEKARASAFEGREGAVVQFHQNVAGGFKRGERYTVENASGDDVLIRAIQGSGLKKLPLQRADRYEVYQETAFELSVGDRIRFTASGKGTDGKQRISNGRMDEVAGFDASGNLKLKSGFTVDRDFGHFDHGYVVTSHASQGKDRQLAIAAMGAESMPAINAKQFYVTVSRGSEDVAIFVENKARVRRAIERSGDQLSATELVKRPAEKSERDEPCVLRTHRSDQRTFHPRRTFRERFSAWWREKTSGRDAAQQGGRNVGLDLGRTLGIQPSPNPGGA